MYQAGGSNDFTNSSITVPTRSLGDNTKNAASTEFVQTALTALSLTVQNSVPSGDALNLIIKSPPAPVMPTPVSTSLCIYIPFNYPTQVIWGTLGLVPLINSITISYQGKTSSTLINSAILTDQSGNSYIKQYGNATQPITGLVFVKNNFPATVGNVTGLANKSISSIVFPQDNSGSTVPLTAPATTIYRNAYIYSDANMASLINDASNNVTVYYKNFSTDISSNTVHFDIFVSAGLPSQPQNVSVNPITATASGATATVTYSAPTTGDTSNPTVPTSIANYKLTYTDISNNIAYGFTPPAVGTLVATPAGSTTASLTLYPDSSYSVSVAAQNSNNVTYGPDSSNVYFNTPPYILTTTLLPSTISVGEFSQTFIQGKLVTNGTQVPNIIYTNNNLTTTNLTSYINDYMSTRGILGLVNNSTKIMQLLVTASGGSLTTPVSIANNNYPFLTYPGFPSTNASKPTIAVTNSGITLTPVSVADSGTLATAGYYLIATFNLTLNNSSFCQPSPNEYTITLTRYAGIPVTTSSPSSSRTFKYYCDYLPASPAVTSFAISNFTSTTQPVTGVYVVYQSSTFTGATTATGLNSYFYNSTQLAAYTITQGSTTNTSTKETTLANVAGASIVSGQITTPCTITNTSITYPAPTSYSTSISATVTVYNIKNTSTPSAASTIQAIFDLASYTLAYTTIKQTLVASSLTTSASWGCRIYDNTVSPSVTFTQGGTITNFPNPITITSTSNSSNIFDNSNSILTAPYDQELQIQNGAFITPTVSKINYSTYYNNTVNYSGLSTTGYRFATFIWKTQNPPTGTNYTNFNIQITGISGIPGITSSNFTGSDFYLDTNKTQKLLLYYRVETEGNNEPSAGNNGSYWVDANRSTGTQVTSSTRYDSNSALIGPVGTPAFTTTSITFKTIVPNSLTSNSPSAYLYVKVGIPSNVNVSFSSIRAYSS